MVNERKKIQPTTTFKTEKMKADTSCEDLEMVTFLTIYGHGFDTGMCGAMSHNIVTSQHYCIMRSAKDEIAS